MKQIEYEKVKEIYGVYILTDPIDGFMNKQFVEERLFPSLLAEFPTVCTEKTGHEWEKPSGIWTLYFVSARGIEDFQAFLNRLGDYIEAE